MKLKIVVARYHEKLEWTKEYGDHILVYNKGEDDVDEYNPIKMENVGREGHTFYKHIYDNYDNLDDYTIFLQGKPHDHAPNVYNVLRRLIKKAEADEIDYGFAFISTKIFRTFRKGCPYNRKIPMPDVYDALFIKEYGKFHESFKFCAGAQIIVSKEKIRERPKEFYLKIVEMLGKHKNPKEGHCIERYHRLVFDFENAKLLRNPRIIA